jgi:hypothetical protein
MAQTRLKSPLPNPRKREREHDNSQASPKLRVRFDTSNRSGFQKTQSFARRHRGSLFPQPPMARYDGIAAGHDRGSRGAE